MLTDVAAVFRVFGTDQAAPVARLTLQEAANLTLPEGSMSPRLVRLAILCATAVSWPESDVWKMQSRY